MADFIQEPMRISHMLTPSAGGQRLFKVRVSSPSPCEDDFIALVRRMENPEAHGRETSALENEIRESNEKRPYQTKHVITGHC